MKRSFLLSMLFVLTALISYAQTGAIRGVVSTTENKPLAGASVQLQGSTHKTVTDEKGNYLLQNIQPGNYLLRISASGMTARERQVQVDAGTTQTIEIVMEFQTQLLREVVVESKSFMEKSNEDVSKLPLRNMENAQVYNTISSVVLRKQIAMTLEDAMKNAAGVSKLWDATNRIDGGSFFTSRGFSTSTKARNGLANIVNTNVDMTNVERIEVIKGPSATLFGGVITSYGGLINRVTKQPYFRNGGTVDLAFGNYGFFRTSADVNAVLDKDQTMAMRMNMAWQQQNSWQDAGFQKNYNIAPSFTYKPNDRLRITLDAELTGSKGNSNGGNFIFFMPPTQINGALRGLLLQQGLPQETVDGIMANAPKTFAEALGTNRIDELKVDYNRSFLSDELYNTTQSNSIFADVEHKLSGHWKSRTAVTYNNTQSSGYMGYSYLLPNYFGTFIRSALAGNPSFGGAGHDSLARMVWNPTGHTRTVEIQQNFISDYTWGNVRNRAVVGLDYSNFYSRTTYRRYVGSLFGVVPYPDVFDVVSAQGNVPNYRDLSYNRVLDMYAKTPNSSLDYNYDNRVYSAYANDVANLGKYVIVSAGVRVDHFDAKGAYNNTTGEYEGGYKQTAVSPRAGLIIMPIPDRISVFANYQNGFVNQNGTDAQGNTFKPEQGNQWEGGVKFSDGKGKITGSLSYYDIFVKNVVRADVNNPQFSVQDGEQRSRGFEADVLANPLDGWMVMLGYGYNDVWMVKADAATEGLRPSGTGPRNTANFWTNYTFTGTALKGLGIGISINYAGESVAVNQKPDGALMLPEYTLVGASLSYDHPRFRFGLKMNNLTNKRYWMGWTNMIPQMPRQLIGTMSFKF